MDKANSYVTKVHTAFGALVPSTATIPVAERGALIATAQHVANTNTNGRLIPYFFHPDHLGSSSYVTNRIGVVSQHTEYLPFGETLTDEHINSQSSPFKYNGKHLDEETGNYYYGARYYDPKLSMFISVDPLAEKYPGISSYAYVAINPVKYIDLDGRDIFIPNITGKNPLSSEYIKQRREILTNLQKLSNSKLELVKTRGGYLVREVSGEKSNKDKNLKEGTSLISGLINADERVTISTTKENNRINRYKNGNSDVKFNPEYNGDTITNEDGTKGRPPEIGLAHELIHADESIKAKGNYDQTAVDVINPDGRNPGTKTQAQQDELNVRKRENIIRSEQGVKPRAELKKSE